MDNKTLKSSIKAYCLELMKEMNSLGGGGEGAYMTKFAGRKVTSKDKTSPTGFETSPKNNYYKKFKFRVTNPYPRKNSKQLWNEIKILKPGTIEFPIYLDNQEKAIEIGKKLFKLDYRWVDANGTKPDWTNAPFKTNNFEPFKIFLLNDNQKIIDYEYTDEIEPVQENKKEFIHRINKEIYQKLDEINNHIEYTSKIKGYEDKEINELNNLKNSLLKIKSKINEIKINKPKRVWDFTKYIPNFDKDKIQIGDYVKTIGQQFIVDDIFLDPNVDDIKYQGGEHGGRYFMDLRATNNFNNKHK